MSLPAEPSPPRRRRSSRAVATLAVGFWLLNALLLGLAGLAAHRPGLIVGAGGCVLVALVVVVLWRRYARVLDDIAVQRRAIRDEVESLRALLGTQKPHP